MTPKALALVAACAVWLTACQSEKAASEQATGEALAEAPSEAVIPGDAGQPAPYAGITEDDVLHFTGTEPFWGGEVTGASLVYTTPEDPDGATIAIERFAGRGGIAFGGLLDGAAFEMMATPLECSDGMSDRTYPFTVTLKIGDDLRNGCGWTERQPFDGPAHP